MITTEQVISIGHITRTHGKRGEIQCLTTNEYWDNAEATFLILNIDNILVPFRVLNWRGKGSDSLIFQLDRIIDEQAAQPLIGCQAYMLIDISLDFIVSSLAFSRGQIELVRFQFNLDMMC